MTTPPDAAHTSLHRYVRTAGCRDPHCGALTRDGKVVARCGGSFTPQPDLVEPGPLWLRASADPPRCCPTCLTTGTASPPQL